MLSHYTGLPLPLPPILPFPQPLQKDNNPLPHTMFLPPLSKGGGLTARHKLLSCCVLIATHLPFYSLNFYAVKTEGLPQLHRSSPSPQPLQKDNSTLLRTTFLPYERSVGFASLRNSGRSTSGIHARPLSKVRCCRPKKFGRLPEGLPHHSSQNRTIPPAFRRARFYV